MQTGIRNVCLFLFMIFCSTSRASTDGHVSKLYDCFMFFNELDILEIKLNELHVDYFVIVEATVTHTGTPKPLYFEENKQRYSKFLDKIIYVVVSNLLDFDDPWQRDYYQRDQILRGLTQCHDDDIIIVEDCDKILRASKLPEIITPILTNQRQAVPCVLGAHFYFLNRVRYGLTYTCTVVAKYAEIKLRTPNKIRWEERHKTFVGEVTAVQDAGWHFTYMGGIEKVIKKFESLAHTECNTEEYKNPDRIREDALASKLVNIDESFPQFIRDHIAYFTEIGFIDQTPLSEEI